MWANFRKTTQNKCCLSVKHMIQIYTDIKKNCYVVPHEIYIRKQKSNILLILFLKYFTYRQHLGYFLIPSYRQKSIHYNYIIVNDFKQRSVHA